VIDRVLPFTDAHSCRVHLALREHAAQGRVLPSSVATNETPGVER
jgi:hypothetical protein